MANDHVALQSVFDRHKGTEKVIKLNTDDVESVTNPRTHFDGIKELAESIKLNGQLQPIVVSPQNEDGKYVIKTGERRWRACKLAGIKVEAIVRKNDADSIEYARKIVENVQREALKPMECALALQELIDTHKMSKKDVATTIGKSPVYVSKTLSLLTLPPEILELHDEKIVSDIDTLYNLQNLYKIDPSAAKKACSEAKARGLARSRSNQLLRQAKEAKEQPTSTSQTGQDTTETDSSLAGGSSVVGASETAAEEHGIDTNADTSSEELQGTAATKSAQERDVDTANKGEGNTEPAVASATQEKKNEKRTASKKGSKAWREVPVEKLRFKVTIPHSGGKQQQGRLITGRLDDDPSYVWVELDDSREEVRTPANHVIITSVEAVDNE
ncbi:ParB family chromosome partitioning protein [Modicisalibacter xianhensis]|uniref:ParB family chromosome partitioning protein n=1 Tax=Modicisalibacter xianhensis TaxID=442341 RepID=A0A4R8F9J6_9GAMM|nr:ParB/RepB/Spo0J family partition protein [Halomonas xianhensis]TDX22216.1 ParB family chromosome partitioning protein [Halomonas xianhensis]